MAYIVRMPKLGLEMETGAVTVWHVDPGGTVSADQLLAEVEAEKTTGEIHAREDGVLRRVYVAAGEEVSVGAPLGIVAPADADIGDLESEVAADDVDVGPPVGTEESTPAADVPTTPATEDGGGAGPAQPAAAGMTDEGGTADPADRPTSPRARRRANELGVDLGSVEGTGPEEAVVAADVERAAADRSKQTTTAAHETDLEPAVRPADEAEADTDAMADAASPDSQVNTVGDVTASPKARRRADELGVDLERVSGTGPDGAVIAADVERAAERSGTDAGTATTPSTHSRTVREERPVTGVRRTIAERLGRSDREAVHVTVHRTVDAEAALSAAEAARAGLDVDVSLADVVLLALSASLAEHPAFNATLEDDVHSLHEEQHVCIAVDTDAGLIAPVMGDLRGWSLGAIARARNEAVDLAREGEYSTADLRGGTFTMTNLGPFGVASFDPVINPPQVAILGVNAVTERPRPADGWGVTFRPRLPLDLSFDHRVLDGADAARFLATLADHLADPWPLVLATAGDIE